MSFYIKEDDDVKNRHLLPPFHDHYAGSLSKHSYPGDHECIPETKPPLWLS
nr:MAG TPA: hypothetical protein [Caudoviricetes sp.]